MRGYFRKQRILSLGRFKGRRRKEGAIWLVIRLPRLYIEALAIFEYVYKRSSLAFRPCCELVYSFPPEPSNSHSPAKKS